MASTADKVAADSPMPRNLITPPEGALDSTPNTTEPLSPMSLAQRVQLIIASTPTTTNRPVVFESPTTPGSLWTLSQSPSHDPPNLPSPVTNSPILSQLYSSRRMNFSGPDQPSAVSIAERSRLSIARNHGLPPEFGKNETGRQDGHGTEVAVDGSSLMLYSPLAPQKDSLVEIAETEYVSFNQTGQRILESYRGPPYQADPIDDVDEESKPEDVEVSSTETNIAGRCEPGDALGTASGGIFRWLWSGTGEVNRGGQGVGVKEKSKRLVWVPSSSELSFQTMWWGYRIYLPPPVLEALDDTQLEVTKRADIIISALKWFLDNIPEEQISARFILALRLLRSLVPLLGRIGWFVARSWSTIWDSNQGHGVTLTATWLLPIVIIPGKWQIHEASGTLQATEGQTAWSKPKPSGTDKPTTAEMQNEGGLIEEKSPDESVPEHEGHTLQELGRGWGWGSPPNPHHMSKNQNPAPPVTQVHPEHGYPNQMHSDSSDFHYAQSHHPPGVVCMPMLSYPMPMHGYYPPVNLEQTFEMYEPTAPPPVLIHTVPLPNATSRPESSSNF